MHGDGWLDGVEGESGWRRVFEAAKSMSAVFARFRRLIQPGLDSSFIKFSFSLNVLFGPVGMHHEESHPLLSCNLPMLFVCVASSLLVCPCQT